MIVQSACGKIILFGEHAVVYGRPALAVPLGEIRARAYVESRAKQGILIHARDLQRDIFVDDDSVQDALAHITRLTLEKLQGTANLEIAVESDIPLASGLGSGAAISTAIVRALAAYFEKKLSPAEISALVFETEKMYHGTPSGIDNTVIAYEQAIRFQRGAAAERVGVETERVGVETERVGVATERVGVATERVGVATERNGVATEPGSVAAQISPFSIARLFTLVIANTGIASPTKITVGDVRRGWEQDKARYENIFDSIAEIVQHAQGALARGENELLGGLMTRNQRELELLGVSSPEIEKLLDAGLRAGARGGKLSGGGRGGNVIFYVEEGRAEEVKRAVLDAGAVGVIVTWVV